MCDHCKCGSSGSIGDRMQDRKNTLMIPAEGLTIFTHEYWNPRPLVRDRRFPPVDDTRDMRIVDGRATPITR